MTDPAAGRRPAELDDREWLRARYERDGDMSIALDLSAQHGYPVSRGMVRLARERLGIASLPPGRRGRQLRVVPPAGHEPPSGEMVLTGTALAIIERFQHEQHNHGKGKAAPVDQLLADRIFAYKNAQTNGDQRAAEDALLSIASAAGLIHQHQRKLRGAA